MTRLRKTSLFGDDANIVLGLAIALFGAATRRVLTRTLFSFLLKEMVSHLETMAGTRMLAAPKPTQKSRWTIPQRAAACLWIVNHAFQALRAEVLPHEELAKAANALISFLCYDAGTANNAYRQFPEPS